MNPLLRGPVVIRPGTKFPAVFVFVVNGNRFSNVEEDGCGMQLPTGRPASRALRGFTFARTISLHASTMLNAQLPAASTVHPFVLPGGGTKFGIATSAGTGSSAGLVNLVRNPS